MLDGFDAVEETEEAAAAEESGVESVAPLGVTTATGVRDDAGGRLLHLECRGISGLHIAAGAGRHDDDGFGA